MNYFVNRRQCLLDAYQSRLDFMRRTAFVAEMPGSDGVVLKIGHFDEVAGVTRVEI
ncbi:hypothetical protein [Rubripirellula tenax]|uniref:hypothetical protein n=1 Tax=Rubripirellula tenax TaxID=2528015 RepID=UPI0016493D6A|nr:hypothetical protein [Rubripirellula tenax]